MDRMPAQKISSQNGASTSEGQIHNTANDGRLIPRLGSPKYTSSTRTSGGSARNTSAKSTIATLIGRARKARITTSARPAQMPVKTTAASISIVTPTPFMIAGKYLWISSHLKNASRKAEWNSIAGSACNDDDESTGARAPARTRPAAAARRKAPPDTRPLFPKVRRGRARQAQRALPPCAVGAGPSPAPEQRFRAPSYADKD